MTVADWALLISTLSFAVATGSLAWNVYSFRRSGPMIVAILDI